ncbi:MAG: hypothetical protein ACREAA_16520 [Candidatus Polarisedimenticolia bacterium]
MKRTGVVVGGVALLVMLGGVAAWAARGGAPTGRGGLVTLTGTLEGWVQEDFESGTSKVTYRLKERAKGEESPRVLTLEFPGIIEGAPFGMDIRVTGILVGDTLKVQGPWGVVDKPKKPGDVAGSHAEDVRVHRMIVIISDLTDLDFPCTVEETEFVVFGDQDESVQRYYWEQSYHQFDLQGLVVGPYPITESTSTCNPNRWVRKAEDFAEEDPVVDAAGGLNSFDTKYYVFPETSDPDCRGAFGGIGGDEAVMFGGCVDHGFAHEMGHNLGLQHAFADVPGCPAPGVGAYCDRSDTMGDMTGLGLVHWHFNAPHKVQMEWIPDGPAPAADRLLQVTQSGLYTISLFEYDIPGANQVLQLNGFLSGNSKLWISYRTGFGAFGENLESSYKPRMHVNSWAGGFGGTHFLGDGNNLTAWVDGHTFAAPNNTVCITMVSHTTQYAHIWVSVGCQQAAPPACPSVNPCNGTSCVQGAETGSSNTGLGQCVTDAGTLLTCTGETVHVVSTNCNKGACCFQQPFPCICPQTCPSGQYLDCR